MLLVHQLRRELAHQVLTSQGGGMPGQQGRCCRWPCEATLLLRLLAQWHLRLLIHMTWKFLGKVGLLLLWQMLLHLLLLFLYPMLLLLLCLMLLLLHLMLLLLCPMLLHLLPMLLLLIIHHLLLLLLPMLLLL